jgi:hypothetical protein
MLIMRWSSEFEPWFTVPGRRGGRWRNSFVKVRVDMMGNPMGSGPHEFFPDEPLTPVQYMPYFHLVRDRFGGLHLLDPFSRLADRWFYVPSSDTHHEVPLEVRSEMLSQYRAYWIEWCDTMDDPDRLSPSQRWESFFLAHLWDPYGAVDGGHHVPRPPDVSDPSVQVFRVINQTNPVPFGMKGWYGAIPPSAEVFEFPLIPVTHTVEQRTVDLPRIVEGTP